jgi:hypothetical protein
LPKIEPRAVEFYEHGEAEALTPPLDIQTPGMSWLKLTSLNS